MKPCRFINSITASAVLVLAACGPRNGPAPETDPSRPRDEFAGPIALRASNGLYVCADQAEGIPRAGALIANREGVGDWERFELIKQDSSHYALRSSNGRFVSAEREGAFQAVADREWVGDWELLEIVRLDSGRFAFRTTEGRYLSAELTEGAACPLCILTDRTEAGAWEAFELEHLETQP